MEIGGGAEPQENPFEGESPFDRGASPETESETAPETEPGEGQTDAAAPAERRGQDQAPASNEDALRSKIINDSVAYIRALAEERGRNADWAELAVRDGVSVTHNEALALGVVDLIADDLEDLLRQIDGRTVTTAAGEKTISTANMQLSRAEPTLVEQVLNFIANPNVAVILMSLATTGIIIEMWNPGSIFPGVVGIMCLLLGLYAFQVLPFNWLGVALMGVGVILMAVEAYAPTFGLAGLVGLASIASGMVVLFPRGFEVSPLVIGSILVTMGGFLALVLFALIGSRSHGPMIGGDAIRRREGVVDDWDGKEGHVIVEGERWRARADKPLQPGDKIKVVDVDGLILVVRQAKAGSLLGGLAPSEA